MIVTVDRSVAVDAVVDDLVGWSASAECRRSWPGVDAVRVEADAFVYEVAIGVPGLPDATMLVEEQLQPVQSRGPLRRLGSDQLWTWPYGEVTSAWGVYSFTPAGVHADGTAAPPGTRLDFSLQYTVPGLAGAEVLNRVRFGRVVEAAIDTYLEGLANQVAVFRTVASSLTIDRPLAEVLDHCLTPVSRQAWPGVREVRVEDEVFAYDVDMRVPGVPPAHLQVQERVGAPVKQRRGHSIETIHRWAWPGGEVSNCWLTYRLRRAGRARTEVELTWRYVLPGTIDGRPIDRPRLNQAVGKAAEVYLHALAGQPAPSPVPLSPG